MRFSTMLALVPLIALAACMPTTTMSSPSELAAAYTPPEPPPPPASTKKVVVMKGTDVSQPVEIIGLIDVHSDMKGQDRALEALKAKAGTLGADAVLDVEYHHAEGNEPSHLSGTAVRFNDLLKGREYDTIGPISATFEMGEEEEGLRALKEKARQVGARAQRNRASSGRRFGSSAERSQSGQGLQAFHSTIARDTAVAKRSPMYQRKSDRS